MCFVHSDLAYYLKMYDSCYKKITGIITKPLNFKFSTFKHAPSSDNPVLHADSMGKFLPLEMS